MEPGSLLFNPTNLRENRREKQTQAECLIKRLALCIPWPAALGAWHL